MLIAGQCVVVGCWFVALNVSRMITEYYFPVVGGYGRESEHTQPIIGHEP